MDTNRAFDILVQATGQINANRETHAAIQQALEVIKQAISAQPVAEAAPEESKQEEATEQAN